MEGDNQLLDPAMPEPLIWFPTCQVHRVPFLLKLVELGLCHLQSRVLGMSPIQEREGVRMHHMY